MANIYRMNFYLLYKSLHLIAVISWMAGLLYLPRIFVYHSEADHESQKKVFKIMERKLYNFIMMPAMLFLGFLACCYYIVSVFQYLVNFGCKLRLLQLYF